jgi:hypothetical protein
LVAWATVAIVSPPEMTKSTTAQANAIRIDRRQRARLGWVQHVEARCRCSLLQLERP